MLTVEDRVVCWQLRVTVQIEDGTVLQERSGVSTLALEQLSRGFTGPFMRVVADMTARLRGRLSVGKGER